MARALLIAEKPSLMREIQTVYNKIDHPDTIEFMAFAGHTMSLCEPNEYNDEWAAKWNWEQLPMVPTTWKIKVSADKKTLYNSIRNKLDSGNYDYIINACDPDREGQAIFQYVYNHLRCKLPIKRFWTNDLTEGAIEKSLRNLRYSGDGLKPDLDNLTTASMLRGRFDWLVGMNVTRAATLKMNSTVRTGRVKTPTLAIVVKRELEIRNFKPVTTYELNANYKEGFTGVLFDEDGNVSFTTKDGADKILKELGKTAIVESVTKTKAKTAPPTLYKLSDLQIDTSKMFGYGADKTLELVQSLYEKKVLSYPRTDNRCISSALAKDFDKLLASVACVPELESYAKAAIADKSLLSKVAKDKKYVDDAKLAESGHYAIVPTTVRPNLNALSEAEKNVLLTVYKRFLSIFLPPLVEEKTVVVTNNNGHTFKTNGKVLVDKGFMVLYGNKFNDTNLPALKKGQSVNVKDFEMKEKTSTAPPRYSDGTLINVMDNPIKFLEDENLKGIMKEKHGIGTEATRAGIISELVKNGYIEKKGKGKVEYIYATDTGISIIQNLMGMDITSVDMTGIWEEKLQQIELGKMSAKDFEKDMIDFVSKSVSDIKNSNMGAIYSSDKFPVVGYCPKCGGPVHEGKNSYFCANYKKTCDFVVSNKILNTKIPTSEIKKVLSGKQSKEFEFKKNDGKTFKASLAIDQNNNVGFAFSNSNNTSSNKPNTNLTCPICGKPIKDTGKFYLCSDYKNPCSFLVAHELNGAMITMDDLKKLLNGETIQKEFTWKSGKKSTNGLMLEDNKLKILFN